MDDIHIMASSIETSTLCTDDSVRQGLKRLRRQNAVPLDLNIIKMAKLGKDVTPPTPQDEETRLQWPSPTKRSSQSPPPTVSPLTEGYDEAGCKPTHVSKPALFHLEGNTHVQLHTFRGKAYVTIRQFYSKDGCDALLPGKSGLTLSVKQWGELKFLMTRISNALKEVEKNPLPSRSVYEKHHLQPENETNTLEKPFKMIGLSRWMGKTFISLREHTRYSKFGKCYPTKKGINITGEQWMWLESIVPDIDEKLAAMIADCNRI